MVHDLIREAKLIEKGLRDKAHVDVFPQSLLLKCGWLDIRYDGDPRHTKIFIDGMEAQGVFSLHVNLNTQRAAKVELGVFLDDFKFNTKPRDQKEK